MKYECTVNSSLLVLSEINPFLFWFWEGDEDIKVVDVGHAEGGVHGRHRVVAQEQASVLNCNVDACILKGRTEYFWDSNNGSN